MEEQSIEQKPIQSNQPPSETPVPRYGYIPKFPTKHHLPKHMALITMLVVFTLCIVTGIGTVILFNRPTLPKKTTAVSIVPTEVQQQTTSLPSGQIAFLKNDDLYLLDSRGEKRLTTNARVVTFKWSPSGDSIAYTSYTPTKDTPRYKGNVDTLSRIHIASGTTSTLLHFQNTPDTGGDDKEAIKGFDFSRDGNRIYYTREGLWELDISSSTSAKLLSNLFMNLQTGETGKRYLSVSQNPTKDILLLTFSTWECIDTQIYYTQTKRVEDLTTPSCTSEDLWSQDGTYVISSSESGYGEGGIWVTDIVTKKSKKLASNAFSNPYITFSGYSAISDGKNILASIGPASNMRGSEDVKESAIPENLRGNNIVRISLDDISSPITHDTTFYGNLYWKLALSPDAQYITYLLTTFENRSQGDIPYDLHIMKKDGTEDRILMDGITDYKWDLSDLFRKP